MTSLFHENVFKCAISLSLFLSSLVSEFAIPFLFNEVIKESIGFKSPASFLFIFVLFNHNFTEKIVDYSMIRTRIVGVEGEHADYLTTITTLFVYFSSIAIVDVL